MLKLKSLPDDHWVLQLKPDVLSSGDAAALSLAQPNGLFSLSMTVDEVSLVLGQKIRAHMSSKLSPHIIAEEGPFHALYIDGVLNFSLTGILARLSGALAAENISLFAVSTYNTDYILVPKEECGRAVAILSDLEGFEYSS